MSKKHPRGGRRVKRYHYKQITAYSPSLDIRNVDQLPRGLGLRYLLCSRAPEGLEEKNGRLVLIAKRWCRTRPVVLSYGEVLVEFQLVRRVEK